MCAVKLDLSHREDTSFEPIPEDTYPLVVTDASIDGPGASGYQYCNWEFTVAEGKYKGSKIWRIMSFSPRARFIFDEVMLGLGEDPEAINQNNPEAKNYEFDPSDWIGARCRAVVTIGSYEDRNGTSRFRNEIQSILPAATVRTPGSKLK